jgi:hypothetical protein
MSGFLPSFASTSAALLSRGSVFPRSEVAVKSARALREARQCPNTESGRASPMPIERSSAKA